MNISKILIQKRKSKQLTLQKLSNKTGIDSAVLSKFEHGKRLPSLEHLTEISDALEIPLSLLKKEWIADKIFELVRYEENPKEILVLAETRTEYLLSSQSANLGHVSNAIRDSLAELDKLHWKWKEKKPLSPTQLQKLNEFIYTEYTFESNRIEGNTLTLQETHLVINEGLTIGGKSLREHLEAVNHKEAIEWIEELTLERTPFNRRSLLDLHYLILKGIDRGNAGKYRSLNVRIAGSKHIPPEAHLVPGLMDEYFRHYENQVGTLHPVLLAAEMHERLVTIHPFIDGNGRTSRLVMNLILLQHGYPMANLKGDQTSRLNYYQALEHVQIDNTPEPFYKLVIQAVESSLRLHLELTGN